MFEDLIIEEEGKSIIYLAGGCFWGIEALVQAMDGVTEATTGYANGTSEEDANYKTVCGGETGFRETVRVQYDPSETSLDAILFAFFRVIDPTLKNRQGNDTGTQYQTGVYYTSKYARETVERIAAIEAARAESFNVEIGPLHNFFAAEEYHQNYLDKNPDGYCHIPREEIEKFANMKIDPGKYPLAAPSAVREMLSNEQFNITQNGATERPFRNEFWCHFDKGIYVDIVTGEPLFSSLDKFESECGWPAFAAPIDKSVVVELHDSSNDMERTEVRSRAGNSHLGHVFDGDFESPTGIRYCINSASIKFIPFQRMDDLGYGYLKYLFD